MKNFLLGIDIGTSSCKVAVFDEDGAVLGEAAEIYKVFYPKSGWAEQNPDDWWSAVCKAVPKVLDKAKIAASDIAAIGIDGQSWSAIALDKSGGVLCNTPIWMDVRSKDICEKLNNKIGEESILALCGNPLQPSYTTGKILWYKSHMPDLFKKIAAIVQSNSFIGYKLTGVLTTDVSQGYGLHCFDIKNLRWNSEMASELGFDVSLLPQLYPCHEIIGRVTVKAAQECSLSPGIPVAAGGLDAACGTLGAGVINAGETQEQGGQAGGMSICTDMPICDKRLILSPHVVPNRWLLQGGTTGGGGVMRWLERELGEYERYEGAAFGKSSLDIFNELAYSVSAGSDGLIFLPYMAGERSPIWDPDAKGVYFGLDFSKTKGHLIRSAMEGCAYALKHNLNVAEGVGAKADVLRAVGGAANSRLWVQIKSDVTGKTIEIPASDTATTLGAAILAGVGAGVYKSFDEAVSKTVRIKRTQEPNQQNKSVYAAGYNIYLKLYSQLKTLMKESAEISAQEA